MANVENFVKITPKDYEGAPDWFGRIADRLNGTLEGITSALQAGLTAENDDAETLSITLLDGQEQEIQAPNVKGVIEEVRVIWSQVALTSFRWELSASGAKITAAFSGSPTSYISIKVKVVGGDG